MSVPSIAVLITYHDEGPLLGECLRSLAAQPPDAILIHDDASARPAAAYIPPGVPAEVIRSEANRGPARARNRLLQLAPCDYVHFHDADDLFRPGWLAAVRGAIAATGADMVLTEVATTAGGALVSPRVLGLERLARGMDPVRFALDGAILTSASTVRREAALAAGGYRESLRQSEDFDFHVRVAALARGVAAVDEPLIEKRNRPDSYSGREQGAVWTCAVEAVRLLAGELPARYRGDLAEKAAVAGSMLYRRGDVPAARAAFALARELGRPAYSHQRGGYRLVARALGPEAAEWLGARYRRLLPEPVRRTLMRLGR